MKAVLTFSHALLVAGALVAGLGGFSATADDCPEFRFAAARTLSTIPSGGGVLAADFNGDGKSDLVVGNILSNFVSILIADGFGTFHPAVSYATPKIPQVFITGDFTNDGKLDLLAGQTGATFSVLPGNGDGTFQAPATTSRSVGKLAVGDINKDGKLDLVSGPTVLFGNGDGTFDPVGVGLDPSDPSGDAPVVVDLNRDGKLDIITVSSSTPRFSASIGNGNRTFVVPPTYYPVLPNARILAVGDFNEDQWPDVIVPNNTAATTALFLNQGNGTLLLNGQLPTPGTNAIKVVVEDFDGDTHLDFAVLYQFNAINGVNQDVVVTRGRGNGTFDPPVHHLLGAGASDLVVGDFNGDGVRDLAVSSGALIASGVHTVVLLGNGNGTFQSTPAYSVGPGARGVTSADLNGDGKPDLIVANAHTNNVTVLLNTGAGGFQFSSNYFTGKNPQTVVVADFNEDSKPDLMVSNMNTNKISLLLGQGDGTFLGSTGAISVLVGTTPLLAGNFNGDTHADIVTGSVFGAAMYPGLGNGTFGSAVNTVGMGPFVEAVAARFNSDQLPDLVFLTPGNTNVTVMLGNANGTFQAPVNYLVTSNALAVAVSDLTGDSVVDLAIASMGCATCSVGDISILRGNGNGTFQPAVTHAVLPGQRPVGIAADDFDGDAIADLAVTELLSMRVTIWRGIGNGTFDSPQGFDVRNSPKWMTVDDLDGNGTQDLVVANSADANLSVLLNTCTNQPPIVTLLALPGGFKLAWPTSATNFDLQSATGFNPLDWQPALEPRTTNAGQIKVDVLFNGDRRFFRLKMP